MKTTTVGLDLAKNVFQVHAIDAAGEVAGVLQTMEWALRWQSVNPTTNLDALAARGTRFTPSCRRKSRRLGQSELS